MKARIPSGPFLLNGIPMPIRLCQPLAADSPADSYDVRQMKKALNQLGYYMPYAQTGITGIPDAAMFDALKTFQVDHNLPATGTARPDDETIGALNEAASQTPEGTYIWRTVGDGSMRAAHAELNGKVRAWSDSPDPGEDFNCRCWAELVSDSIERQELEPPKIQEPRIPGTDIPDKGIPEQGWPGSRDYDPFRPKPDPQMDPGIMIIPPNADPYMKEYKDIPWYKRDKNI